LTNFLGDFRLNEVESEFSFADASRISLFSRSVAVILLVTIAAL